MSRRRALMAAEDWDFSWNYTMGKLEDQTGWTSVVSGTASSILTDSGERITSSADGQLSIRPIDGTPFRRFQKGVIECSVIPDIDQSINTHNFRIGIGIDSTSRITVTSCQNKWRILDGASSSSCTPIADLSNGVEYLLQLVLDNGIANIFINGNPVLQNYNTSLQTGGGATGIIAQGMRGKSATIKTVKIKAGRI